MTGEELYSFFCRAMDAQEVKLGVEPWHHLHNDAHAGWNQLAEDLGLDADYRMMFKPAEYMGQPVTSIHLVGAPLPYVDSDQKTMGLTPAASEIQKMVYIAAMAMTDDPRDCKLPEILLPIAFMQGLAE